MIYSWIKLPLFDSWNYSYKTQIGGTNFTLHFTYSDRTKTWSMSLSEADGTDVVTGTALLIKNPLLTAQRGDSYGFFWVEPKDGVSDVISQYPDQIHKYYNFYYIYQ